MTDEPVNAIASLTPSKKEWVAPKLEVADLQMTTAKIAKMMETGPYKNGS